MDAWRHLAAFAEKDQAAVAFHRSFPVRTALFAAQQERRLQLSESLLRWRCIARRDTGEVARQRADTRFGREADLAVRRQLAHQRWKSIFEEALTWNLLRTSWSSWHWSIQSEQRDRRQVAAQERRRHLAAVQAAEGEAKHQRRIYAAWALATCLGRSTHQSLRHAVQCLRREWEAEPIYQQLEAARTSAALVALNRQCLEDWLVQQHQALLGANHAAQEVAAQLRGSRFGRRALLAWRVGTLLMQSERKRQWQDLQRRAQGSSDQEKRRAVQAKAAEALCCSTGQQVLRLILRRWQRVAFKEKQTQKMELLRQTSQTRLAEQQRRLEQARLATDRYRAHAFASCFATSTIGSPNWLRMFLWDWRRSVTSSTSINILRLWYSVASLELFKCKRPLLCFCLQSWLLVLRLPKLQQAYQERRPIPVLHLEATLEERLTQGEARLLQYVALCAWRRFFQGELLKMEVKRVCRQWNMEEEQVAVSLQHVQQRMTALWLWTDLSLQRLQARQDLREVLLAWAQLPQRACAEAHWRKAQEEAQNGTQLQQQFEVIVRRRWTDRSLSYHRREVRESSLLWLFLGWRRVATHQGAIRRRLRSRRRALSVAEQWAEDGDFQTVRMVFDSWQTALCTARQDWLDQRRQWLESLLQQFPGSPASASARPRLTLDWTQKPDSAVSSPLRRPRMLDETEASHLPLPTSPGLPEHAEEHPHVQAPSPTSTSPSRRSPASSPTFGVANFTAKLKQFTFGLPLSA